MLFDKQDLEYRDFNSKIIPNIDKDKIIGVRMPVLRDVAKKIYNCFSLCLVKRKK